jgi:intraflagellar transport protein 52
LIVPQFETPLLGLQPAVFPPIVKELPPPPLELFDLDEEFASEKLSIQIIIMVECASPNLQINARMMI